MSKMYEIQLAECGFRNKLKVSLFEFIQFHSRIFIFKLVFKQYYNSYIFKGRNDNKFHKNYTTDIL
jgi:hypothetical protein